MHGTACQPSAAQSCYLNQGTGRCAALLLQAALYQGSMGLLPSDTI